ncbi:MAG TPA: hypothetical protein VLL77_04990 [Anaerolineales bacterium]|nr:hypothetical protein [Anaerolineales bacterium]
MDAKGGLQPLGAREDLALSREQVEMLLALEQYDLWFVEERLARKDRLPVDRIPGAILEFKRYMALVGLGHRGLAMVSPEVDDVWHALILFTRQYADFCQQAFGTFIHHVPRTSRTPLPEDGRANFLAAYEAVFGDPPTAWYPAVQTAKEASTEPSGCGTEDCVDG